MRPLYIRYSCHHVVDIQDATTVLFTSIIRQSAFVHREDLCPWCQVRELVKQYR